MEEFELTLLDVGSIEEQLSMLTRAITEGKADDISTFFRDLLIRLRITERTLNEYKRFIPIQYNQLAINNEFEDGQFEIEIGPYASANQSLILMIPKEGSVNGVNNLVLKRNNVEIKRLEIYKESNNGQLIPIGNGDIVPGRSVLFRLMYTQLGFPRAVIINTSGLYSETISNLYVTGETYFATKPIIMNEHDTLGNNDRLVSKKELDTYIGKVDAIDRKIIITTENPQDVAERADTPVGAIIFQLEND